MEVKVAILVAFAGFLTGAINTVSAAGSLVSLPALMIAGLPIELANGTNRIAIAIQCFTASQSLKSVSGKTSRYTYILALAAVPGAMLGAWFAVKLDPIILTWTLRIVILIFIAITISNPLKHLQNENFKLSKSQKMIGVVLFFLIGIYGGFIQAGTGFFIMSVLLILHKFSIVQTNYIKAIVMLTYTLGALLIFGGNNMIDWQYALILSAGGAIGAWVAGKWSLKASANQIKIVMVTILTLLSIKLWFFD